MEYDIRNAIWSLHANKAPGPDGFTINFYKAAWNIIKEDLKKMLNLTRKKDNIGGETNSSFLALIPKEKSPLTLDRFRPISLCNTSYKILSKILASRMKSIMGCLISYSQGGFIAGRQNLDNIIIVRINTLQCGKEATRYGH